MRSSSMSATSWALGTLLDFVKISEVTPMDEPPVAIDHCHQWKSASKRAAKGSLSLDPNIDHPQVTSVCWHQVWFWYRTYKLLNWTQRAYARLFRSSFFENFCSCLFQSENLFCNFERYLDPKFNIRKHYQTYALQLCATFKYLKVYVRSSKMAKQFSISLPSPIII